MIQGLLLAAGKSKRFGAQKLLAELPNRYTVAAASFHKMKNSVDSAIVVVRPDDAELIRLFSQEKIQICSCPENTLGMGHSIACGVVHTKDASGWVIGLADMPFIKPETIESVARVVNSGADIAVPVYRGRRGHPVGFSKALYSELIMLKGDVGARCILDKYPSKIVEFEVDDPGIHADIDTLEDFEKYTEEYFTRQ